MKNVAVQVVVLVVSLMVGCLGLVLIANVWWQSAWSGQADANPLWGWLAIVLGVVGTVWSIAMMVRGSKSPPAK